MSTSNLFTLRIFIIRFVGINLCVGKNLYLLLQQVLSISDKEILYVNIHLINALSPFGGTPEDQNETHSKFRSLDNQDTVKNFVAAVPYLKTHPLSTGKIGCTGFC